MLAFGYTFTTSAVSAFGRVCRLYTFIKDTKVVDKTMLALAPQAKAVRDPCELLYALLRGMSADLDARYGVKDTRQGRLFASALLKVASQLKECEGVLEALRQSTASIHTMKKNVAAKAWIQIRLNMAKDEMIEARSQLALHISALGVSIQILSM